MAPPPLHNPTQASTSRDTNNGSGPLANLRRLHSRWKENQMQGMAPKLLFMAGFLINSTALGGLFFLLTMDMGIVKQNETSKCEPSQIYGYSISFACLFFIVLSLFVFIIMCLMQCKRHNLEHRAYNIVSMLGSITLLVSTCLVIVSVHELVNDEKRSSCKAETKLPELKLRYVVQSAASFVTALIYTVVGVSLVKRQNQAAISPVPPPTPIYQIRPPEFDSLFPPPPTYQQSEMYYQQRMNR